MIWLKCLSQIVKTQPKRARMNKAQYYRRMTVKTAKEIMSETSVVVMK